MKVLSKLGFCVFIGVVSLSGCKDKNEGSDPSAFDDQAYFTALRDEAYISKSSGPADIEALSNLFLEPLSLTYDGVSYSEKSGATIVSNVNLNFDDSDLGVNIETLSLWDVNEAAISDRLLGKNLQSDLPILGRFEAQNISAVGLETAFKPLMDKSNDISQKMVEDSLGNDVDIDDIFPEQSLDKYDVSLGSVVMTNVKVHPWLMTLTQTPFSQGEGDPSADELWHVFQKVGAFSNAISFDDYAAYDGAFEMTLTQDDVPLSIDMTVDLMAYKGYARGDLNYGVVRGMTYEIDMPFPDRVGNGVSRAPMKMTTSIDVSSHKKLRLSQLMKHLAIGEMPDPKNTDFMSLGVWTAQDSALSIDGQILYTIDSYTLNMSEFHGVVPEVLELQVDNAKYNVAGFMSWAEDLGRDLQLSEDETAEMKNSFAEVVEILEKHDMAEPSFDGHLAMHWNAETGVSDFGYGFGIDDIGRSKVRFEGIMPNYDSVIDILPENIENLDESQLKALFEEKMAFKQVSYELRDEGFDRLLELIIDFSKMVPSETQQAKMLKNATPQQLRQMLVGVISISGTVVAQQFPPAVGHMNTLTDFVTNGGVLKVEFEARSPLNAQGIEQLSPDILTDTESFEDVFRFDVMRETAD